MDEPRRNDVIEQQLRRAFAARGSALSGGHVDAEAAAAWMDRRLDATAARAIEAHAADCPDCQAMLATLARISPDGVAATEGLAWWRRVRAGWLVPATVAAAAAFVIWVAVPQQRNTPTPAESRQARDDRAAAPAPPPAAPAPADAPATTQPERAEVERKALRQQKAELPAPPPPAPVAAPAPPAAERREFADAGASPPPPAVAPAESDKASKLDAVAPKVNTLNETITVTGESPVQQQQSPRQEAAAGAATRALGSLAERAALSRADGLVIIAADSVARWRRTGAAFEFAPRGDAPFTVTTLPVAANAITAGSSPGGIVCWLAGRGGVVLVAIDGLRFRRVTVPASADLIAITATDARSATVTATDGRRFRTTDQGATWSPQ